MQGLKGKMQMFWIFLGLPHHKYSHKECKLVVKFLNPMCKKGPAMELSAVNTEGFLQVFQKLII